MENQIVAALISALFLMPIPTSGDQGIGSPDPCPIRFGLTPPTLDVENPDLNLIGTEGMSELEVLTPSDLGLFLARSNGLGDGPLAVEIQTMERRPSRKVPVRSLAGALSLSTAVSSGDRAAGIVTPGQYRVVLWYQSPLAPSGGRLQRLCMAASATVVTSKPLWVHLFE